MLERLLRFSLEHRWLVLLATLGLAGFGAWSLGRLPIDAVPDITNNQVQINTVCAALSPVEMEKQVTFPVETALAGIPGLVSTRSLSRDGFSQVTAIFEDHVSIWFARSQVAERIAEARDGLPPGAEPAMGAITTGLGEVCMWTVAWGHPGGAGAPIVEGRPGWQGDGTYLTPEGERLATEVERAAYLRTVQDWIIRPQLKSVRDVAGVDSIGGYVKQFHVQPDPVKLVSYGLDFGDVLEALERNNASTGAGFIERGGESVLVRAAGRIDDVRQIADLAVGGRPGVPVRIRDVATVGVGKELRTGSASANGEEVVVGTALMLVGANSRTVAAAVTERLEGIRRSLPPDVEARTVLDRTKLVDATIGTIRSNLFEGAILVIVVLFLLLGNIPGAVITATAIPLSMLLTAIGMVETRTSGNLMSLGAIDFGLIVDGAVIVVENCLRRLGERQHALGRGLDAEERLREVAAAAKEMIRPSFFGQAIIITVYVPILALTGIEGKMFHPMAITVIFALVAAFVLSLTFIPAAVAIVVRGRVAERDNPVVRLARGAYAPVAAFAVRRRKLVVAAAVAAFGGSLLLFGRLGQEFVPTLDEGDIAMHAMRIPGTGITRSTEMQRDVERAVAAFPEVACVFSKTGTAEMASDPMPPNVSDTFVILHPRDRWPDPKEGKSSLIERLEKSLADVPGNNYEFTQPIQMRFNELIAGTRGDVAIKVHGDEFDRMVPAAEGIARVLRGIPGAADVKVEQTEGLPVMEVRIDREALARHGLDMTDVQDVVSIAVGGREAGLVFEGDRRFAIVVRLPDALRADREALRDLPVPLPGAEPPAFVPLSSLATIEVAEGPNQVSRENGKRRVVVQANVRGRDLAGFVNEARAAVDRKVPLPAGTWLSWGGQFENLVAARERLSVVVPACFLLIFVLLFAAFGSARHAVMVFSGVPLALTGGILALWMRGMPFSISAAVGFIALSGVAVLNGLVMVSAINRLREEGTALEEAITRGSLDRLRPVLMTALVAALGFLPMALATGSGAEVQRPLATVVIGGIVSSTLLTLVVLPALYRMWHGSDATAER